MILSVVFLLSISILHSGFADTDLFPEPWGAESFNDKIYILDRKIEKREGEKSIFSRVAIKGIKFFQEVISPIDGDRCPMHPTCSNYGIQAIRKHGFMLGTIMISDRLIHERDEVSYAPRVRIDGRWRYFDPVQYNDFWFVEE
ncbi:MAG: membrane protein insertion efficiency factor YidD [Thermodesulfobacteriota bacterium]|nr:membrane protein insertion efficiency factor YidD [Thermodesulfobacteriota bacterium]